MLIRVPAIKDETRKKMNTLLADHLGRSEDGLSLDAVIEEVLCDRDLFTFLAAFLPPKKGISLGVYSYWDDITVNVEYGLVIPPDTIPRRTRLFISESVCDDCISFKFSSVIPYRKDRDVQGYPSAECFADAVNEVLSNPKEHVIDLPEQTRGC